MTLAAGKEAVQCSLKATISRMERRQEQPAGAREHIRKLNELSELLREHISSLRRIQLDLRNFMHSERHSVDNESPVQEDVNWISLQPKVPDEL